MRVIAVLLIIGGILALIYGGFSYVKHRDTASVGPMKISVEEKQRVNVPPIAGAVAVVGGVVLLLAGSRSRQV